MEEKILSIVVKAVISLVVALITTFLIPAITNWIGNLKNTRVKAFITSAVRAAEQIYGGGTATVKKQYVIDKVKEKFKHLNIDSAELDTYIEDAVYEVSGKLKGAVKQLEKDLEAQKVNSTVLSNNLTIVEDTSKKVADTNHSTSAMKIS